MRRHTSKRHYAWSPDMAYLVGLIASDGCLVNDGRHINITSKDLEVISTFQKILGTNYKLGTKIGGYGSEAFFLQFSNVALYVFLQASGLTPAKSKTIGELNVPDIFYRDFLRGYFDGDGTVYGYWDRRWRNSLMYYSAFISASMKFLMWLQKTNCRLVLTSPGTIKPGTRAYALTYAKADSQKLFRFMYYDKNLPVLSRKRQKFIDFIRDDPYASKELARVLESGRQATLRS